MQALLEVSTRGGAAWQDALECCVQLVCGVQERLALLANPAVPPLVGGTGNLDQWVGQPSVDQEEGQFEYLTAEVVQLLQQEQLSVEGFCLILLTHGAQAVKGVVTESLDQGAWSSLGPVSRLVCVCVELLKACCVAEGGLDTTHDMVRVPTEQDCLTPPATHHTALLATPVQCPWHLPRSHRSGPLSRVCLTFWDSASASGGVGWGQPGCPVLRCHTS